MKSASVKAELNNVKDYKAPPTLGINILYINRE